VKLVGVTKAEQGVMSYFERQPCVIRRRVVTTVSGYKRVGNATYAEMFRLASGRRFRFSSTTGRA
jgi:hypothetical protein